LLVEFGRIQGFVPNSHEPELRHIHDKSRRTSYKARQEGESLPLKVIEIDRSRERLVLSATAAERELREKQLLELDEGQTVEGDIVHITDYGAFVDLGHVTGLLHISKIAWERIDHPKDVLEVGESVEVIIDEIDVERERVSLNRRVLQPSPWDRFMDEYDTGDLVEGVVTDTVDFGAFVLVAEGIEGLVHVSEMDISRGEKPESALQPGDAVLARIIKMEPQRDRLSLSMRRVSATEEVEWMMHRRQPEAAIPEAPAEETKATAEREAATDGEEEAEAANETPSQASRAENGDAVEASLPGRGEEEEE
jgi:small subunit ribosomal protein S1